MNNDENGDLPKDLLQTQIRFQTWRIQRPIGSLIPQLLWWLAVGLVHQHGLSRTATVLKLDYYSLKKQPKRDSPQLPSRQPPFIPLPLPSLAPAPKQALFELEPSTGGKLQIQLLGYDTADLETLVRHFGNQG